MSVPIDSKIDLAATAQGLKLKPESTELVQARRELREVLYDCAASPDLRVRRWDAYEQETRSVIEQSNHAPLIEAAYLIERASLWRKAGYRLEALLALFDAVYHARQARETALVRKLRRETATFDARAIECLQAADYVCAITAYDELLATPRTTVERGRVAYGRAVALCRWQQLRGGDHQGDCRRALSEATTALGGYQEGVAAFWLIDNLSDVL